jgi:hypothetical protein
VPRKDDLQKAKDWPNPSTIENFEESHRCTKKRLLFGKYAQKDNLQMAKDWPKRSPNWYLQPIEMDFDSSILELEKYDPLEEENRTNQSMFLKFSRTYFRPWKLPPLQPLMTLRLPPSTQKIFCIPNVCGQHVVLSIVFEFAYPRSRLALIDLRHCAIERTNSRTFIPRQ